MVFFNDVSSAIFGVLLAPFGHGAAGFDLVLWPVLMGVVALYVYKKVSNQRAIARVKSQISMHLLEIRLFNTDIALVLASTARIVVKNFAYIGHNLTPVAVLMAPMVVVMVQLVAHYGYAPARTGAVEVLILELDPGAPEVSLVVPKGVVLEVPAVRTAAGRVFWRLRADEPGDHVLLIEVGEETFEKRWAVGGAPRLVPVKRLRSWEAILYPGEAALPAGAPVASISMAAPTRALRYLPDGELGILTWTMVLSLVAGFALKDVFGVVL